MTVAATWKDKLGGSIREDWAREIDIFETQIELRKKGKIEEKLFAETRLRRGCYGQRYDNGQRHDGEKTQALYAPGSLTKGPNTYFDAPGMMRIKIPFGRMTPDQMDVLCELAEETSDQILHVTTRQDIQLHFVHIEDTPDLMRRLAAVGITTREACGNAVRNVTACPIAGVCSTESFDVTPYANAIMFFLLGHDDTLDFGRKFKIAFSGCHDQPCGLTNFHDMGAIAKTRVVNGETKRGFELVVGGGLGAVPYPAALFDEFVAEEDLFPITQAICRVFGRLGEKENRSRARIKFLVKKLGIDEFRRLVLEERTKLRPDPRWTSFLASLHELDGVPLKQGAPLAAGPRPAGFDDWYRTNVQKQRQAGYAAATVTLPLGDFTPKQGRVLGDLARRYSTDAMRTTVAQNMLFRWIPEAELPEFYSALAAVGLGRAGAETITDVTSCPGTDTCKLGISSSRGLAGELRKRLSVVEDKLEPAAKGLHIKCSGCFNSCGQHHVADLGFLGVSRNVNNRRVAHFQLVVGGQLANNGGTYGLAIGAIPSKRVPDFVDRMTKAFVAGKTESETFLQWITRIGKKEVRKMVDEFTAVPTYEEDPSFYSDWGDPREYTIGDMGEGECAGEVVNSAQFGLAASEREVFEAQLLLEEGKVSDAGKRAYSAMLQAARALAKQKNPNLSEEPQEIEQDFRKYYYDTKLFFDPFEGGKFAHYFFKAHEEGGKANDKQAAHQLIEEAQLFVDAAHQCYTRIGTGTGATVMP
jgi:sulfite reductase (ferredoxin)